MSDTIAVHPRDSKINTTNPFEAGPNSNLRRRLTAYVVGPIIGFIILNVLLFIIVRLECWALGEVRYSWSAFGEDHLVCRPEIPAK
jgi:hypothetical protein